MITIKFFETFWEKTHLRINPDMLRELLMTDATFSVEDPDTNKIINYHAHDLLDVIEYDKEHNEYVFPIVL